jgi:urease accessory protein
MRGRYYQRAVIDLEAGARLVWGDVWLPGRYARGEASEWFQFERIIQELEVRREGEPVYRERFHWEGPWGGEEAAWFLGPGGATGSMFVTGPLDTGALPAAGPIERAVLPQPSGDTCIRYCGPPAEVTAGLVRTALTLSSNQNGDVSSLLSSHHLAPNHWFASQVD